MTEPNTSSAGVETPAGTGGQEGVPPQDQPITTAPTVPAEPPTAPGTAARVNLDNFEEFRRWKSEYDRRNFEAAQEQERLRQEAQRWKTKAETADMVDEEKYKYLYDQTQKELAEMRLRFEAQEELGRWQYAIAQEAGVNPGDLNPSEGVYGMVRKAFELQKAKAVQTPPPIAYHPPVQQPPTQQAAPASTQRAPAPPTSSPSKGISDELMSLPIAERRKRLPPKGSREFEELMEKLGEQ